MCLFRNQRIWYEIYTIVNGQGNAGSCQRVHCANDGPQPTQPERSGSCKTTIMQNTQLFLHISVITLYFLVFPHPSVACGCCQWVQRGSHVVTRPGRCCRWLCWRYRLHSSAHRSQVQPSKRPPSYLRLIGWVLGVCSFLCFESSWTILFLFLLWLLLEYAAPLPLFYSHCLVLFAKLFTLSSPQTKLVYLLLSRGADSSLQSHKLELAIGK